MANKQETKVLLYGLGAIGSFYAFVFSKNDNVVLDVVARSNYDAVKKNVCALIFPFRAVRHLLRLIIYLRARD